MKPVPLGEIVVRYGDYPDARGGSCLACQRLFGFGEIGGGIGSLGAPGQNSLFSPLP